MLTLYVSLASSTSWQRRVGPLVETRIVAVVIVRLSGSWCKRMGRKVFRPEGTIGKLSNLSFAFVVSVAQDSWRERMEAHPPACSCNFSTWAKSLRNTRGILSQRSRGIRAVGKLAIHSAIQTAIWGL